MLSRERIKQEARERLKEIITKGVIFKILERGVALGTHVGANNGWYGFRFAKKEKGDEQGIYESEPIYPTRQDAESIGMEVLGAIRLIKQRGLLEKILYDKAQKSEIFPKL